MKKVVLVLIIGVLALYFYPTSPDSFLSQIKSSILGVLQSTDKSRSEYAEVLRNKTAELESYEKALEKAEEYIRTMEANAPNCPKTGQQGSFRLTQDPRQELNEKISRLKEDIAFLKSKMGE